MKWKMSKQWDGCCSRLQWSPVCCVCTLSTQPPIPPWSVNEYQLRLWRQRQVRLIPIADERVGVQVKLWDPLRTRAIPERFWGDYSRRGAISSVRTFTFTYLYLYSWWRCVIILNLLPCSWISVLNNAKEQVLMKAFGDSSNSESSPYNQSVKELTRTILQQVRQLPGNRSCCDCGAPGY